MLPALITVVMVRRLVTKKKTPLMPNSNNTHDLLHQRVQALLTEYQCPYQFHEVRASFMGAIASPYVVDPTFELNALWDGEFPEVESAEKLDDITETFLQDFWEMLTEHQDPEHPFALTPAALAKTLPAIKAQATLRGEELDAFLNGFYQDQESLELDEDLGESLDVLEELVQMYTDLINMEDDVSLSTAELTDLSNNLSKMTDMAQMELNNLIASHS